MKLTAHQFVDRDTGEVRSERPFGDWIVNYLYCQKRERAPMVYQLLGSQWFSGFLGWVNYDFPLGQNISGIRRFLKNCAVDLSECLDKPEKLDTARKVFERRIRYWLCRPMCDDEFTVVSPADSRIVLGTFKETSTLVLKGKFFDYEELLGPSSVSTGSMPFAAAISSSAALLPTSIITTILLSLASSAIFTRTMGPTIPVTLGRCCLWPRPTRRING